jgi:ssDNA-binding Zn-finger/Zn-ribbon topoisomerase 1
MTEKTDLESLRALLGRGPASLLLWIASQGGRVGPIAGHKIYRNEETLKRWRRELESAGQIRTTLHRSKGYVYELVRPEGLPLDGALDEWRTECEAESTRRAAEVARQEACQVRAEAKRQKQREYRERWLRKKFGTCPECGLPMIQRNGKAGLFVGCTGWPSCGFTARTKEDIVAAASAVQLARIAHIRICLQQYGSCGKCGAPMTLMHGKHGPFLGCTAYPRCRFTQSPLVENWPKLATELVQ